MFLSSKQQSIQSSKFLIEYTSKIKEKLSTNSRNESSPDCNTLTSLINKCKSNQIPHRSWLSVRLNHIQLDLELASRNISLSQNKPAILVNSEFRIAQMNEHAKNIPNQPLQLHDVAPIFNSQEINSQLILVPTTIASANHQSQSVLSSIVSFLQQFDKEVEPDYSSGMFYLDITNYLMETAKSSSSVQSIIKQHFETQFKITCTTRIAPNILLSRLAQTQQLHQLQQKPGFTHFQDFTSHQNIEIMTAATQAGLLSQLLAQHLYHLKIHKIQDIFSNRHLILATFGESITKVLLNLYFGVGRVYHEYNNSNNPNHLTQNNSSNVSKIETTTLKATRQLGLNQNASLESVSEKVREITNQLTIEMKHLKWIAKSAKLTLIRADHSMISARREFILFQQNNNFDSEDPQPDYFDNFKSDCLTMLKTLRFSDTLLRSVGIQLFEFIPNIDAESFTTRFQRAIRGAAASTGGGHSIFKKVQFQQKSSNEINNYQPARIEQQFAVKNQRNFNEISMLIQNYEQKITEQEERERQATKKDSKEIDMDKSIENLKLDSDEFQPKINNRGENGDIKFNDIQPKLSHDSQSINLKPEQSISMKKKESELFERNKSNSNSNSNENINDSEQMKPNKLNENLLKSKKQHIIEKFTCPICGNQIDCKSNYSLINQHVDQCLIKQTISNETASSTSMWNSIAKSQSSVGTTKKMTSETSILQNEFDDQEAGNQFNFTVRKAGVNTSMSQPTSVSKAQRRGRPLGSKNSKHLSSMTQSVGLLGFGFTKRNEFDE